LSVKRNVINDVDNPLSPRADWTQPVGVEVKLGVYRVILYTGYDRDKTVLIV